MIVAEILHGTTRQKITDVFIPQTARDIKYSAFLEFSFKANEIFIWLEEQKEKGTKHEIQYLMKICETVASVLNVDPNVLKNVKYGDANWIWDAWYSINNIIKNYVPSDNGGKFELNGKQFTIPTIVKSIIRDEVYLDSMIMQQVSEISVIEKKLSDILTELKEREQKEPGFNKTETEIQQHFAYALMKIGIVLSDPMTVPTDATFDRWLDERVIELEDISMVDALDTIFFLIGLPKDYGILIDLDIILKKYLSESYIKKIAQTTMQE